MIIGTEERRGGGVVSRDGELIEDGRGGVDGGNGEGEADSALVPHSAIPSGGPGPLYAHCGHGYF